jgi:hypothetical protein
MTELATRVVGFSNSRKPGWAVPVLERLSGSGRASIYIPGDPDPGLSGPGRSNSLGRFTQITVFRLLTTEQIMGVDTKSMAEAWSLSERIWADDRVVFVPKPEDIDKELRARFRMPSHS